MERKTTITYRWWRGGEEEVLPEHVEELEDHAGGRIAEMTREGYTSGELCACLRTDDEQEIEYRGWWEVKTDG